MNRLQREGVWRPLTHSQRRRAEQEYNRVLRTQAGAVPGVLPESLRAFCQAAFAEWNARAEAMQMQLAREVGQFYLANRRLLNPRNAREVYLHNFLARMRQRVRTGQGVVYPSVMAYLNESVPGWMRDQGEIDSLLWLQSLLVDDQYQDADRLA